MLMELICKKLQSFLMVRWTISQDQKAPEIFHEDSVQFSSVTQSCPTLCDPMNHSTPGLPVHQPTPGVYSNSRPLSRFGWHHQLMRTKSPLKQTQGSRPSPEGNPEGSVIRNGTFVSLVFQSRAKSGMPSEERLGIYGRKNKIHFGSQFKGPAGQHGALTVTQSIHSSLLAPVPGHTSLHTQCTPEVASYLDVPLQQTREMEAKKESRLLRRAQCR